MVLLNTAALSISSPTHFELCRNPAPPTHPHPNMEQHLITEARHHWNVLPLWLLWFNFTYFYIPSSPNMSTECCFRNMSVTGRHRYNCNADVCNKKHHRLHHSQSAVMDPNYFTLCTGPCMKWRHSPTHGGGPATKTRELWIKCRKLSYEHTGEGWRKKAPVPAFSLCSFCTLGSGFLTFLCSAGLNPS